MSDSPDPKPEAQPVFLYGSAEASSTASASLTTPAQLGPASASAVSSASGTLSTVPLIHVASATVYPSAGASQVVITRHPDSPLPGVEASLAKNAWDLATISTGVGVGYAVGHLPGGVIGGIGCYAWGRVRWWQVNRKP